MARRPANPTELVSRARDRLRGVAAAPRKAWDRATEPFYRTETRAEASTGMFGAGLLGMGAIQSEAALRAFSGSLTYARVTLQAGGPDGLGAALCQIGVGQLLSALLYLGAIYLAYLTIGDVVAASASGNSRSSGSQNDRRSALKAAGAKAVGAVAVAGMPTLLAGAGFTLLECVEAVNILG